MTNWAEEENDLLVFAQAVARRVDAFLDFPSSDNLLGMLEAGVEYRKVANEQFKVDSLSLSAD